MSLVGLFENLLSWIWGCARFFVGDFYSGAERRFISMGGCMFYGIKKAGSYSCILLRGCLNLCSSRIKSKVTGSSWLVYLNHFRVQWFGGWSSKKSSFGLLCFYGGATLKFVVIFKFEILNSVEDWRSVLQKFKCWLGWGPKMYGLAVKICRGVVFCSATWTVTSWDVMCVELLLMECEEYILVLCLFLSGF